MKKLIVLLLGVLPFCLTGCRDEVRQLSGSYSYKISGIAVVEGDETRLGDEMGAMDVVRINGDSVLLTFNALTGPAYYTRALINGKKITVDSYTRSLNVNSVNYTVTGSGEGEVYDETILITLRYQSPDVKANQLTLLCKKN